MSERNATTEAELIELVRSIDVRAPEELHRRTATLIAERAPRSRRRASSAAAPSLGLRLGGGVAVLVAAVLALAIVLGSGGSGSTLTLQAAAALALRPATMSAPAESPRVRTQLAAAVDGVAFPYWGGRFGWHSAGARTDRISGRAVMTVFYANGRGQRIGYSIIAGTPAPRLGGRVVRCRAGTPYHLLTEGGSLLVTWVRSGHLCVVAGRGVQGAALLALASWDDRATAA